MYRMLDNLILFDSVPLTIFIYLMVVGYFFQTVESEQRKEKMDKALDKFLLEKRM